MLDIVVPVYNEDKNILRLLDEIEREIKTPKRVMVLYDYAEDTTVPVIEQHKAEYSFKIDLILNTIGRGALNAIKMGMNEASEEMVLPKLANEEVVKKENNEPVIKENDVPLFQRFNQETYDLNQKD